MSTNIKWGNGADWLHKVRKNFKKKKKKTVGHSGFKKIKYQGSFRDCGGRNPQSVSLVSFPVA